MSKKPVEIKIYNELGIAVHEFREEFDGKFHHVNRSIENGIVKRTMSCTETKKGMNDTIEHCISLGFDICKNGVRMYY